MKIYVRKILKHDVTHEVSVTINIVKEFFEGNTSFTMIGKKTNEKGIVTINSATDARFGGDFKKLLRKEGDVVEGDIVVIYKDLDHYLLDVVNKNDSKFNSIMELCKEDKRHTILYTDNESLVDKEKIDKNKEQNNSSEKYDKNKFLDEVFMDEDKYNSIVSILEKKKNIILEGAPGVGKTFMAKRLAYSIIGAKDNTKVELIQFHQSYSYEDFIEGYRPCENGFKLQNGIFYELCKKANKDKENNYYIIIDEINRGNLSKIFGELLMLIESDKRGEELTLVYSGEKFSVPENLYIIGLMNTADRSLALIDYALRRRFSFIKIEPAFENLKFIKTFNEKFDNKFNNIIDVIKKINEAIEQDKSLGAGFKIGHSYFCPNLKDRKGNKKDIEDIIMYEIVPLLEEYWYDDEESIIQWKSSLNSTLNGVSND